MMEKIYIYISSLLSMDFHRLIGLLFLSFEWRTGEIQQYRTSKLRTIGNSNSAKVMQLSKAPPIFNFSCIHSFLFLLLTCDFVQRQRDIHYFLLHWSLSVFHIVFYIHIQIYILFSESVSHGFAYLYFSRKTLESSWSWLEQLASQIWTVLLGLALSFCAIRGFAAAAAAGCTSVCSPLETSPERAGARARDRDGERRRDEDGIETDGQSRGVDALASRREARNEA